METNIDSQKTDFVELGVNLGIIIGASLWAFFDINPFGVMIACALAGGAIDGIRS